MKVKYWHDSPRLLWTIFKVTLNVHCIRGWAWASSTYQSILFVESSSGAVLLRSESNIQLSNMGLPTHNMFYKGHLIRATWKTSLAGV